jgi:hypothetical protein
MKKASAAKAAGNPSSGVPMPGIDKPTGRVVALIVLMIFVAAALRGYLPAQDHAVHDEPGSGRAAATFVIAALTVTVALLAIAVIARLRDPRAVAPSVGDLSGTFGADDKGRRNWRVLLIAFVVLVAWLMIMVLLVRLFVPHTVPPSAPAPAPIAPPSGHATGPPPQQHPQNNAGDMVGVLLAGTIPILLVIAAGSMILANPRHRRPVRNRWSARPKLDWRRSATSTGSLARRSLHAMPRWSVSSPMFRGPPRRTSTRRPRYWSEPSNTERCEPITRRSW